MSVKSATDSLNLFLLHCLLWSWMVVSPEAIKSSPLFCCTRHEKGKWKWNTAYSDFLIMLPNWWNDPCLHGSSGSHFLVIMTYYWVHMLPEGKEWHHNVEYSVNNIKQSSKYCCGHVSCCMRSPSCPCLCRSGACCFSFSTSCLTSWFVLIRGELTVRTSSHVSICHLSRWLPMTTEYPSCLNVRFPWFQWILGMWLSTEPREAISDAPCFRWSLFPANSPFISGSGCPRSLWQYLQGPFSSSRSPSLPTRLFWCFLTVTTFNGSIRPSFMVRKGFHLLHAVCLHCLPYAVPLMTAGLWNLIFLFSNIAVFILMPFAYLFTESEGLPGSKKVSFFFSCISQPERMSSAWHMCSPSRASCPECMKRP